MRWLALLVVTFTTACRSAPVTHPATHPIASPPTPATFDAAAIESWVAAEVAERGVVGAALVVVRDGSIVLARGFGTRTVGTAQPIDADTPFAIGSVSKQFACAAALSLVDDGKLSMTEPVATFYPALTAADRITLADLGAHIAGYRDYYPLDYIDRRILTPIAPDDLIARYAGLPLDFEPRTRWSYSNTGYVLLARIVERVAGMSYAKVLEERVFKPLGMTRSTLTRPATAATGHDALLLEAPTPTHPEAAGWLFGAGDIYASAHDLARWDLALATGTILSEPSRRAMTTPHHLVNRRSTEYGCGLRSRVIAGETVLAHSGWVGGSVAYNSIVPRTRSAVILLVNDQHVDVGDLHDKILRLVLDDPSSIPEIAGPPAVEAARTLVMQLQRGTLDRATLGADLNDHFDARRLAAAAATLRALGTPTITLVSRRERGAMEVTTLAIAFPTRTVEAVMFRDRDGTIRQFQMTP